MNWARAKTLLMILLFTVNLVLGGLFFVRETQVRAVETRAKENLCALLEQRGLTARPEQIPSARALTYDAERAYEEETPSESPVVAGLPVWGQEPGNWHYGRALPIDNRLCYSAGYSLLQLTDGWGKTGVLELCELGFSDAPIAPGVIRLRPCWRFLISGEEYFVSPF